MNPDKISIFDEDPFLVRIMEFTDIDIFEVDICPQIQEDLVMEN